MVLAYLIIFTAYGFWLPNDPRGSWSEFVASWDLLRFGRATKTTARHSLARVPHDEMDRLVAKDVLKHSPVHFGMEQILCIARGFALAAAEAPYVPYACAILDDYCHLVLARHARPIKQIVGHLKARATRVMNEEQCHPLTRFADLDGKVPTPWVEGCWKVFLDEHRDIVRAIDYVERNPVRAGMGLQKWDFVAPYRR